MLHRGLSRRWGAWVEMAMDRAIFMQKLRKGVSFMVNRKLAVGFSTWRVHTAPATTPRVASAELLCESRAVRGWKWHAIWAAAARKRASMKRGLAHLINRHLSRGYNAWIEMAVMRAEFLQLLRKG